MNKIFFLNGRGYRGPTHFAKTRLATDPYLYHTTVHKNQYIRGICLKLKEVQMMLKYFMQLGSLGRLYLFNSL